MLSNNYITCDPDEINPCFCVSSCRFFDPHYSPTMEDYEALRSDGCCLYTKYSISCQHFDHDLYLRRLYDSLTF